MSINTRLRRTVAVSFVALAAVSASCSSDSGKVETGDAGAATTAPTDTTAADDGGDAAGEGTPDDSPQMSAGELLAWIEEASAKVSAASDACEVDRILSEGPDTALTDEATARAAAHLVADAFARIAELLEGLDEETRRILIDAVADIRAEADDPDLDVDAYLVDGPTAFDDDTASAAFAEADHRLWEVCESPR